MPSRSLIQNMFQQKVFSTFKFSLSPGKQTAQDPKLKNPDTNHGLNISFGGCFCSWPGQKYASMSVPLGFNRPRRTSASELMCQHHMGKELQVPNLHGAYILGVHDMFNCIIYIYIYYILLDVIVCSFIYYINVLFSKTSSFGVAKNKYSEHCVHITYPNATTPKNHGTVIKSLLGLYCSFHMRAPSNLNTCQHRCGIEWMRDCMLERMSENMPEKMSKPIPDRVPNKKNAGRYAR